jgi:hypothetical protein
MSGTKLLQSQHQDAIIRDFLSNKMFVGPTSISATLTLLKRHIHALRQLRNRLHTRTLSHKQMKVRLLSLLMVTRTNGRSVVSLYKSFP